MVVVISDASGSWGCGAFTMNLFQIQWPQSWTSVSIAAKELLRTVAYAAVWAKAWASKQVLFCVIMLPQLRH